MPDLRYSGFAPGFFRSSVRLAAGGNFLHALDVAIGVKADNSHECGGAFIYALFSREKNGAKFCQGARNGAGCRGVKGCGVVQLGAARNCAVCAVLLQIYLHCLRFKCARLIAFEAGFIPAFLWALFGEVVGDVDDLAADLDVCVFEVGFADVDVAVDAVVGDEAQTAT